MLAVKRKPKPEKAKLTYKNALRELFREEVEEDLGEGVDPAHDVEYLLQRLFVAVVVSTGKQKELSDQ